MHLLQAQQGAQSHVIYLVMPASFDIIVAALLRCFMVTDESTRSWVRSSEASLCAIPQRHVRLCGPLHCGPHLQCKQARGTAGCLFGNV